MQPCCMLPCPCRPQVDYFILVPVPHIQSMLVTKRLWTRSLPIVPCLPAHCRLLLYVQMQSCCACLQVEQLMLKLDEQLQLLRQATPLLRQRAQQLTDAQAAEVREQLALVLDQQTDQFEESMKVRLDIVELYL